MLKIKYFNDDDGRELHFTEEDTSSIAAFDYESDVKIPEEFIECAYKDSMIAMENVRLGKCKPRRFTKLPYMYRDFKRDGMMQYPFFEICDYEDINSRYGVGYGRCLIANKYFPDMKIDIFKSCEWYGIGGTEIVQEAIDIISKNNYWKDKDIITDYDVAVVMMEQPEEGGLWYIKAIDFGTEEYMNTYKNFRPQEYCEKTMHKGLWELQEKIILNSSGDCYDEVILGTLDYIETFVDEVDDEHFVKPLWR